MSTIQLNPEQQSVLDGNGIVRAIDPRTNTAYVLVPEQEYLRANSDAAQLNGMSGHPESGIEAARQFREWISSNAVPSVSADDSRESIYAGRGK